MAARVYADRCDGPANQRKLFKKSVAAFILFFAVSAEDLGQKKFSGQVAGIGDEPLIDAGFLIKSSQEGVTANENGKMQALLCPNESAFYFQRIRRGIWWMLMEMLNDGGQLFQRGIWRCRRSTIER